MKENSWHIIIIYTLQVQKLLSNGNCLEWRKDSLCQLHVNYLPDPHFPRFIKSNSKARRDWSSFFLKQENNDRDALIKIKQPHVFIKSKRSDNVENNVYPIKVSGHLEATSMLNSVTRNVTLSQRFCKKRKEKRNGTENAVLYGLLHFQPRKPVSQENNRFFIRLLQAFIHYFPFNIGQITNSSKFGSSQEEGQVCLINF